MCIFLVSSNLWPGATGEYRGTEIPPSSCQVGFTDCKHSRCNYLHTWRPFERAKRGWNIRRVIIFPWFSENPKWLQKYFSVSSTSSGQKQRLLSVQTAVGTKLIPSWIQCDWKRDLLINIYAFSVKFITLSPVTFNFWGLINDTKLEAKIGGMEQELISPAVGAWTCSLCSHWPPIEAKCCSFVLLTEGLWYISHLPSPRETASVTALISVPFPLKTLRC